MHLYLDLGSTSKVCQNKYFSTAVWFFSYVYAALSNLLQLYFYCMGFPALIELD